MSEEENIDFHFQRIHSKAQNGVIQPILTDLYQITMAYAYWKSGKMNDQAVFDLYFRKNPFNGEFTIFAGLEECIKFLKNFHFTDSERQISMWFSPEDFLSYLVVLNENYSTWTLVIAGYVIDVKYIRSVLPPNTEPEFFQYLENLTAKDVTLHAVDEGTVVFPKEPLMWIEGPLPAIQLMETPLLNLVNYASLVATNAMRFRLAAGPDKTLLEFGLRRAQGPDGALSASRYCYLGGFDGTSNVLAGKLYGIPVRGTHAHAFVTSYSSLSDVKTRMLKKKDRSAEVDFVSLCLKYQAELSSVLPFLPDQVNAGELAAFVSYAQAFPDGFLALIDTYDAIKSGLPNFCAVAMALWESGYSPQGIRLDSGDLSYLSHMVREGFNKVAKKYVLPWFANLNIVASNDINEDTIHSLNQQGHEINSFGIGTHLVTCQKQPALGGVFKLTEVNCKPRMKLSEDVEKVTIPGKKNVYRLYGADGNALVDLMTLPTEPAPKVGQRVLCRHPFQESKRAYVIPAKVEDIHKLYWVNGEVNQPLPPLTELRAKTMNMLKTIRQDHKRALNPTPYKVSVSTLLYSFMHDLWLEHAPIGELS